MGHKHPTDQWTKAGAEAEHRRKRSYLFKHILRCQACGHTFGARRRDAKFCSAKCRQQKHRDRATDRRLAQVLANPTPPAEHRRKSQEVTDRRLATKRSTFYTVNCIHCGRGFTTDGTGTGRLYCSNACRQAAYRARKKAAILAEEIAFLEKARQKPGSET